MKKSALLVFVMVLSLQIFPRGFIIINGDISNLDPHPPSITAFTPTEDGPYADKKNRHNAIINICEGTTKTIYAKTIFVLGESYQWYRCIGTINSTPKPGQPPILWSSWASIKNATSRDYTVKASDVGSEKIALYTCKISKKDSTTGTGVMGFVFSAKPSLSTFAIDNGYVCPGQDAVITTDFSASGTGITAYWEEKAGSTAPWIEYENPGGVVDPLLFSAGDFMYNNYDYRLVLESTCLDTTFPSLHDYEVLIDIGTVESYSYPTDMTPSTCLNSEQVLNLTLNNSNSFHTYTYKWEKQNSGSSTWEAINSDMGGVFSNYNSLNLGITPNSEEYHDMKFRCTTYGACDTLTSTPFTLLLKVPPTVTGINLANDTVCKGGGYSCTASIEGNPLATPVQYNWLVNGNVVGGEGFGISTNNFSNTVGTEDITVTCQVRNGDECVANISEFNKVVKVYRDPGVTINVTETGCGASLANLTAEVVKGKKPYSYLWAPGGSTSQTITNVPAGLAYAVSVTDACANTDTASVIISSFPELFVNYTKEDVKCNGQKNGSFTALVAGGVTPYKIRIFKKVGAGDSLMDKFTSETSGLLEYSNLYAGEYTIDVLDNCDSTLTQTILINQPNMLNSVISDYKNVSCRGGGDGYATVSVTGGTEPYAINWSNDQKNATALGLFAGQYTVNVIDDNGCFSSRQINITEPGEFSMDYELFDVTCPGADDGAVEVYLSGGKEPYTSELYQDGNLVSSGTGFSGLASGDYQLEVSDSCGNSFIEDISITAPGVLSFTTNVIDVSCYGRSDGEITVFASGGVEPYTYQWSDGSTDDVNSGLIAGKYAVTVYDAMACGDSITDSITVNEPEQLSTDISVSDISCYGKADGSASVQAGGGTLPYLYSWSNGQNQAQAIGLYPGLHSVNVIDANGCVSINNVTINQPEKLTAELVSNYTLCGQETGSVEAIVSGGTSPYSYIWDNNGTGSKIENLAGGTYQLDLSDANGCTYSASTMVDVSVAPVDICIVTVDTATGKNQVVWRRPMASGISQFNIYKQSYTGGFDYLASSPVSKITTIVDGTSEPDVMADRYKITTVDSCGNESEMSKAHKTLHLNVSKSSQTAGYALTWGHYEGYDFDTYIIYRGESSGNLEAIDSLAYDISTFTYTDTKAEEGKTYYYRVAAVRPGESCLATKANSGPFSRSLSNLEDNRLQATGVLPQAKSSKLHIYPNPMVEYATIEFDNPGNSVYTLSLIDVSGRVLRRVNNISGNSVRLEKLDLKPGTVLIRLEGERIYHGVLNVN